jgi:hypothetical protein
VLVILGQLVRALRELRARRAPASVDHRVAVVVVTRRTRFRNSHSTNAQLDSCRRAQMTRLGSGVCVRPVGTEEASHCLVCPTVQYGQFAGRRRGDGPGASTNPSPPTARGSCRKYLRSLVLPPFPALGRRSCRHQSVPASRSRTQVGSRQVPGASALASIPWPVVCAYAPDPCARPVSDRFCPGTSRRSSFPSPLQRLVHSASARSLRGPSRPSPAAPAHPMWFSASGTMDGSCRWIRLSFPTVHANSRQSLIVGPWL